MNITIGKIIGGGFALIGVILLVVFLSSWEEVEIGHEGYVFTKFGSNKGLNTAEVITPGKEFIAPWNDLRVINVQEQKREFSSSVLDKEGLTVDVRCFVNFQLLRGGSAGEILKEKGEAWVEKLVDPAAFGAIKEVAGKYYAEELYSTKREVMQTEIADIIINKLSEEGIETKDVIVADVGLPPSITGAIEDKQKQDQQNQLAQKKELEQTYLANAKYAEARGDSLAVVTKAAGQAEAYKLLTKELNDDILMKQWIDTWNGQVSTVSADGSGMIFDIGDLK